MTEPPNQHEPDDRPPMVRAIGVASQVTSVAAEMVVPTLLGYWLDTMMHTQPLFLLLGTGLGLTTGFWHLIVLAKQLSANQECTSQRNRRP